MAKTNKDSLTDQQEKFCREYLVDLNATKAAIRAKYSEDTAPQQGSRLLSNAKVQSRISVLKEAQFKRLEIDGDEVLRELKKLGLSDLRELFDENNCLKDMKDWPAEVAACVSSVEVLEEFQPLYGGGYACQNCNRTMQREMIGFTKKVKFWDKPKSLELLGKHKNLFTDKIEANVKVTLEDLVLKSMDQDKD